jgi:hypothetical protein
MRMLHFSCARLSSEKSQAKIGRRDTVMIFLATDNSPPAVAHL